MHTVYMAFETMTLFTREHTIESNRVYDGNIFKVRVDKLQAASGQSTIREVVEHNGGVAIVCQPQPDKVILIRQYRYSIDEDLIELPAGRIEKGEQPLPAAQRELTEETGYLAHDWQELIRIYSAPGFCSELLYLYKASNVEIVGKSLDEDEETEVLVLSLKDAWKLVCTGQVRDAKTVAGLGMIMNV